MIQQVKNWVLHSLYNSTDSEILIVFVLSRMLKLTKKE